MSVSVLTRGYSSARDGATTQESVLTAAAVRSRGIKRLFSLSLPGDARGAEAQPLIVPGVALPGGRRRDLVLLATMANRIFAFDANDGTTLWERTLGTPINGSKDIDAHLVNDHWGVLSTPVVDPAASVMYACAWISPDGSPARAQHWLYAISIVDGRDVRAPLNLEGATYDPGHGLPVQRFASATRKQRASLLLVKAAPAQAGGKCSSPLAHLPKPAATVAAGSSPAIRAHGASPRCGRRPPKASAAGSGRRGRVWSPTAQVIFTVSPAMAPSTPRPTEPRVS